ncbi:PspC domain-containing protein [Gordonia soli]|uniref:Phage shock protein PspC N-terminal domain-containing protein n=1 Tax=Gordonia soli NBRC 108243 TaxID=1223545 RepID=M0QML8_9ACTN|nr:hypothetical protein GS4_28_01230 [Gordonia soli NBRC 108243]
MDTKQLEGLWATRPVRPTSNRTIAGVCAGIAARYRTDPTVVKIAFVVAALFGGSGLLLYIAAWIALPSERKALAAMTPGGSPSGTHGHHGPWHGAPRGGWHGNPQFILLIVLAIVVLTSFGPNRTWGGGGLLGAALMLLGWWLLYQRTPEPPAGTSVDTVHAPTIPTPGTGAWSPTGWGAMPGEATEPFQRWMPRGHTGFTGTPTTPATDTATPPTVPSDPTTAGSEIASTLADPAGGRASDSADAETPASEANPRTAGTPIQTAPTQPAPTQPAEPHTLPTERLTPPAWDPLGAARFAWDLPEPAGETVPERPSGRRSPLSLIVIGLAVLAAAAGVAANQAGAEWFSVPRILSIALAVVGAGLVIAAFRRRRTGAHSTGLVPIAILLGAAVVVTTSVTGFDGLPEGGTGERIVKPFTENDIRAEYSLTVGRIELDLRDIDLTKDRTVQLQNGIGEVKVLVPENMNVRAQCAVSVGDYTCPEGLDGGRDGTDGPVLTVDAKSSIGNVEIVR